MRGFLLSASLAVAFGTVACGGSNHGTDICATTIPPPAACMTACNASPGAPDTCPSGFYCDADGKCNAQCTQGGSQCGDGYMCSDQGQCIGSGQCTGIACQVAACNQPGQSPTTITGTVYAPNGTLPLYGVDVYVPNTDPGDFPTGVQCTRCADGLPGNPIVQTTTDESGSFTLTGIPSGTKVPVVISIGKWRREITIPTVSDCTSTAIAAADTTLPKSMSDMTPNTTKVDIPMIAISTGNADSMECLIRRIGVDESEIGTAGGTQHVQMFTDKNSAGVGVSSFDGSAGGGAFADSAAKLWDSTPDLSVYDIVILSCEGQQAANTKPQTAMDALKGYADAGGRVFMSHWHNIWIEGSTQNKMYTQKPAVWPTIATWTDNDVGAPAIDLIDETSNPKGSSFATWMLNVGGSTVRDQIPITNGKGTALGLDESKAERWVYTDAMSGNFGMSNPQDFQFLTPNEDTMNACGKVVFSDMHVSGNSNGGTYPSTCGANSTLSPQEKAITFMLFDIASCVGTIQ